jgi:hypothetical protein
MLPWFLRPGTNEGDGGIDASIRAMDEIGRIA